MIGCFGVAPARGQAISTATSAENGGNMDYRALPPGPTVWFPVSVPGALFFLGDCHAIQGDGEIVGTGIETSFEIDVRLTVEKGRTISWPRGETADDIFTVGKPGRSIRRCSTPRPRCCAGWRATTAST